MSSPTSAEREEFAAQGFSPRPVERTCPVVTLDPWEYDHAHHIGIRRSTANWETADRPSYRNDRKQDERTASPAAAIAELAVAKHLGLYWPGTVWANANHKRFKHLPDVAPNIEVRRIRAKSNRVAIRTKDLDQGLILVAAFPIAPEFREVEILRWLTCEDAWRLGTPRDYDTTGNTRGVVLSDLLPIETFFDQPARPAVAAS